MVYDAGNKLRRSEINLLVTATGIRQIQYLGSRLVDEQCEYEPEKIAEYAIKKGCASRLGYLAETALEAAKETELTGGLGRVGRLVSLLDTKKNEEYVFLAARENTKRGNNVLKRLAKRRSTHRLNEKWKVFSAIHSSEIKEYIELYLFDLPLGNLVKVCEPNICEEEMERNFRECLEIVYGD